MGSQHEEYAAWFEKRRGPRDSRDEAKLLAIADAYDAIVGGGTLSAEQLQLIVAGASSPQALIWCGTTDLLRKLSGDWPEAAAAILKLSKHRQSHVRFAAICSLGKNTPTSIIDAVLKAGISDRSSRIRWKAAQEAADLERVNLVPEITAARAWIACHRSDGMGGHVQVC